MREDRRFVSGQATYVSDVTPPGTRHAAVLTSPYACARIVKIDAAEALAMPGVHAVVEGRELAAATDPLLIGVDAPLVKRYPLAVGRARYAGEWVAVVVAETRALAEDAREKIRVEYEELPFVLDAEAAYQPDSVPVHPEHGSNVLLDRRFVWGDVDAAFAAAPHKLAYRVKWGRSATVPIETFGVVASWDPWREMLDVWASIQMPKFADQIARALRVPLNGVRVHQDVDVGGSYGVKRGIKHTVLAGFLSRKLGAPVKLIEDRLENMRGGDMHGPERVFDVELAFDGAGLVQAMRMRAIDNVGAYAGRSPLQLGKPVGAIVGPYRIKAVAYHAIAVTTNKTPQEAVRGFGQAPTNYAIETGHRPRRRDAGPRPARGAAPQFHPRRRVPLSHPQRHHLRQRRLSRRGGQDRQATSTGRRWWPSGTSCAPAGVLPASASPAAWSPAAPIPPSSRCSTRRTPRRRGWSPAASWSMRWAPSRSPSTPRRPARATRRWPPPPPARRSTSTPTAFAWCAPPRWKACRATAPSAAAWRSCWAARPIRPGRSCATSSSPSPRISGACRRRSCATATAAWRTRQAGRALEWMDLVLIAHRHYHLMPPGMEPGIAVSHIMQVPTGGGLPTPDGRVQMYPCFSFEFHVVLLSIDPEIGKPQIHRYVIGHDCGTVINPDIVRGMTLGGIAHGIGAALLEEFAFDGEGQLLTQSFMDYLLPSAHEVPEVEIVHHVTPSPHTVFGQKGSGESGYLGAPAAISSAINDAVRTARHPLRAAPHPHLGHRRRHRQGQGTAMIVDPAGRRP